MTLNNLKRLLYTDLYRYVGEFNKKKLIRSFLFTPGFNYTFWFRVTQNLKKIKPLYILSRLILKKAQYKYGIEIPYCTKISEGLYISHGGGIVINGHAVIGKNFTLSQGVTIGLSGRGSKKGVLILDRGRKFLV